MPTLRPILDEKKLKPPLLYAISNRRFLAGVSSLDYLKALFRTPAQIIQWREKDLPEEENRFFVKVGSELSGQTGKIYLVNSDWRLALQEGCPGAHLNSHQDLEEAIRGRVNSEYPHFLLGKSVHSIPDLISAEQQGADYALLAPIFDPISKPPYCRALGIETLRKVVASVSIPVFALGGITEANALLVLEAGAFGIAGISWVYPHVNRALGGKEFSTEKPNP